MIFYEGTTVPQVEPLFHHICCQIVEDNATVSLENVNEWNSEVWRGLPKDERHDVAVWLTRLNIGSNGIMNPRDNDMLQGDPRVTPQCRGPATQSAPAASTETRA